MPTNFLIVALLLGESIQYRPVVMREVKPWSAEYQQVSTAATEWRTAIQKHDYERLIRFAELPETRKALDQSIRQKDDAVNQYFFGKLSMLSFFSRVKSPALKIFKVTEASYYVCWYDPSRFKGEWTYKKVDNEYPLDLNTVLCINSYAGDDKTTVYVDYGFPIFTGD